MSTITTGDLSAEVREHYDKTMLHVAMPELVHARYARKKTVPKGEGKVVNWRRHSLLDPATTPLTEGVTPAGQSMSITNVAVTVNQYGGFTVFSDRVNVQSIDDLLSTNAKILGQQAGNTMDQITRDEMVGGSNVLYANSKTSRVTVASGDIVSDTDLKKLRRGLKRTNTVPFSGGYYVSIVHPDTYLDLQGTDGYKQTGYNRDTERIYDGRVITLYGIKFIETTNAKVFEEAGAGSPAIDVYAAVTFGQEAFAVADIASLGLDTIYKPLGSSGVADPLNQRQSQGWKATFAAKRLNEDYILRYEHATTA